MVTKVTGYSRNGVSDWIFQRASAVILAAYTLFIVGYLLMNDVTAESWSALFNYLPMQIFSLLAVGFCSPCMDRYVDCGNGLHQARTHSLRSDRFDALILFAYLVWGVAILFGN